MAGFKNVACPSVFIYHHESISFSQDKTPLPKKLKILDERYPSYHEDVQHWIAGDILRPYRNNAVKRLMRSYIEGQKIILHISHRRGGGTQEYIDTIAKKSMEYVHIQISSGNKLWQRCKLSLLNIDKHEYTSQLGIEINEDKIINEFEWLKSFMLY